VGSEHRKTYRVGPYEVHEGVDDSIEVPRPAVGSDERLDTPAGCVAELAECNREIAKFDHQWSRAAGELKRLSKRYERLYKVALRATTGKNADERTATAHAAVEAADEGISERMEGLVEIVEFSKTRFAALERRSSNAQSILSSHREAAKMDQYVAR
jgi:exonuclease VII large subunit